LPSVGEVGSPQCVVGGYVVVPAGYLSAAPVLVAGLFVVVSIRFAGRFLHCNPSWLFFLLDVDGLSFRTRLISFRKRTSTYTVLINAVYRFVVPRFCGRIKNKHVLKIIIKAYFRGVEKIIYI